MAVRPEELAIDATQLAIQLAADRAGADIGDRMGVAVIVCDFETGRRRLGFNVYNGNDESIVEEAKKLAAETVELAIGMVKE